VLYSLPVTGERVEPIIAAAIQKAYELIKAGKLEDAQAILVPIVRTNPNTAEAWYMLGFALTDSEKRLYAFQQVTRIDPSSQLARDQIAKLLAPKSPTSPSTTTPGWANPPTSPFTVMPDLANAPPAPQPAVQPAWAKPPAPYPVNLPRQPGKNSRRKSVSRRFW
jgi:hypothetical protein